MKEETVKKNIGAYIRIAREILQDDLNSKAGKDFWYEQVIEVAKMVQIEANKVPTHCVCRVS